MAEKSQQVQMMKDIYAKSESVLSWLGVTAQDSDTAMDLLKCIGEKAIETGILDLRGNDLEDLSNPGKDERSSKIAASIDAFAQAAEYDFFDTFIINLSERKYWTRMWVMQSFCGFARRMRAENMTLDQWADRIRGPRLRAIMATAPNAAPNVLMGIRRRYQREIGDPESVFGLLKRSCFAREAIQPFKATDSRDNIYGLLGLDPLSKQLGIMPDYNKSTKEVYTAATRAFITG
ncbi:hypothetical protein MMC18_004219 [Xylographa bjoerkii]|nr:hypothetical protein [Xylographa bjoerkii]